MKIHITDASGNKLYNRLHDDGGNVLTFESGNGHVCRDRCQREGWIIVEGWY